MCTRHEGAQIAKQIGSMLTSKYRFRQALNGWAVLAAVSNPSPYITIVTAACGRTTSWSLPFGQRYGHWRRVCRSEKKGEDGRRRDHEQRRHRCKLHLFHFSVEREGYQDYDQGNNYCILRYMHTVPSVEG